MRLSRLPGPGTYDTESYNQKASIQAVHNSKYYANYAYGQIRYLPQLYYANRVPRFNPPLQLTIVGPGEYEPNFKVLHNPRINKPEKSERLLDITKRNNPNIGPGSYKLNYDQIFRKTPTHNISTTKKKHQIATSIGPGSYDISNSINYLHSKTPHRFSMIERFFNSHESPAQPNTNTIDYSMSSDISLKKHNLNSSFARQKRFSVQQNHSILGPGYYEASHPKPKSKIQLKTIKKLEGRLHTKRKSQREPNIKLIGEPYAINDKYFHITQSLLKETEPSTVPNRVLEETHKKRIDLRELTKANERSNSPIRNHKLQLKRFSLVNMRGKLKTTL